MSFQPDPEFPKNVILEHPHRERNVLLSRTAWASFRSTCDAVTADAVLAELRTRFAMSEKRRPCRKTRRHLKQKFGDTYKFYRDSVSRFRFTIVPCSTNPEFMIMVGAFRFER